MLKFRNTESLIKQKKKLNKIASAKIHIYAPHRERFARSGESDKNHLKGDLKMDISEMRNEREKLFSDFFNNITPQRLPLTAHIPMAFIADWADEDLKNVQFDYARVGKACDELCDLIYSDEIPIMGSAGAAPYHQALGSQTRVMGSNGFIQHPDASGMDEEDYDLFIQDPLACLIERVVPRIFKNLDPKDPITMMRTVYTANGINMDSINQLQPFLNAIGEKQGYYLGAPFGSSTFNLAPCDFVADQCRGFSNFSKDIRRDPEKIKAACDAVYPYIFLSGLPSTPDPRGAVSTPLHMPPFMREKDFVNVWLPTYKRMLREYASLGVRVSAFLEADWTRYVDIVYDEFPAGTKLQVEQGDPKLFKEKLGNKFILSLMYSLENLRSYSKAEAIDNLKALLDIVMPGCGYLFGFSTYPIVSGDIQMDNYVAIMNYLRDNAKFDNPSQPFGTPLNSENFKFDLTESMSIHSKYSFDWDKYKKENPFTPDFAKDYLASKDIDIIKFYIGLFY